MPKMSGWKNGIWKRFHSFLFKQKQREETAICLKQEKNRNPYLPQIREIIEAVLEKKKIPYEKFFPIIIDGEDSAVSLQAIKCLGRDLNYLTILTDRIAYFEGYAEIMYEEQGLIIGIFSKTPEKIAELSCDGTPGNVILDFEGWDGCEPDIKFGRKIYIPIFKKAWESAGNLDIAVPIGYNTVIVKGIETMYKQPCLDKFEQAFYENE